MLHYKNVLMSDSGEHKVLQTVVSLGDICDLIKTGKIHIGNPRPDHDLIPKGKSGALRYRRVAARVSNWAEDLLKGEAVLGNLTWNLQAGTEIEVDGIGEGIYSITVDGPGFATDIDSATRMRAIEMAMNATPCTMNLEQLVPVQIFPLSEGEETRRLFWIYNQIGEKVSNTVAKATYQGTPHQKLAEQLMVKSPHLTVDNIETKFDSVSKNSPKLVAFGTLSQAIEDNWTSSPGAEGSQEFQDQLDFLMKFWDALVGYRPEVGHVSLAERQAGRGRSLVATAVAMYGYIAVADKLYKAGVTDFSSLAGLTAKVTMPAKGFNHSAGDVVDMFDYDNPAWQKCGVLVQTTDKKGVTKLASRMSFQTRKAMADEMLKAIGV